MDTENFSNIAKRYEESSIVQKSAGDMLLSLLDIRQHESVLDVGCGTGNLTKKIYDVTKGKTVGVDVSEGMIRECLSAFSHTGIQFHTMRAEDLSYENEFDVIFCNSTFQWVQNVDAVISNFSQALKKGGRVGIQAPAKKEYSPNFISAVHKVAKNPRTREYYDGFRSPWFFLDTSEEYSEYFCKHHLRVALSRIQTVESFHSPEETFKIFASGAIAGYLNEKYYTKGFNENYCDEFQRIVKEAFTEQVDKNGMVKLIFNRIFLVAEKV